MNVRRSWPLVALLALAACGGGEPANEAPALETAAPAAPAPQAAALDLTGVTFPDGVTADMANAGAAAWPTQACIACHSVNAKGAPGLGPDLTDGNWLHSDGSFEGIKGVIIAGVPQPKEVAAPMLPMGGTPISDEMVANLSAYIWAISHTGG